MPFKDEEGQTGRSKSHRQRYSIYEKSYLILLFSPSFKPSPLPEVTYFLVTDLVLLLSYSKALADSSLDTKQNPNSPAPVIAPFILAFTHLLSFIS